MEDDLACKAQAMKNAELFSLQELVDKYFIQYAIYFHDQDHSFKEL